MDSLVLGVRGHKKAKDKPEFLLSPKEKRLQANSKRAYTRKSKSPDKVTDKSSGGGGGGTGVSPCQHGESGASKCRKCRECRECKRRVGESASEYFYEAPKWQVNFSDDLSFAKILIVTKITC